jgi:hypothetical protein
MELDVTKERRTPRSFTLLPSTINSIEALADLYGTNASRIIEAMVLKFGPKLIDQMEKKQREAL